MYKFINLFIYQSVSDIKKSINIIKEDNLYIKNDIESTLNNIRDMYINNI